MSVADDVNEVLAARGVRPCPGADSALIAEDDGPDAAIVSHQLPTHKFAKQKLSMEVRGVLEDAGFAVELDGSLRPWTGYPPGVSTGRRDTGGSGYARSRSQPPFLRVTRKR